jgi:uncharacterized membrane protein
MTSTRRGYLDWLRGVAVLIMIEAHILDSWTRLDQRGTALYGASVILGGFGAPLFLFLAGVAVSLSAGSKLRARTRSASATQPGERAARQVSDSAAASRAVIRRGLQIFLLAFLFRLQAMIVSWGSWRSLLKVDILNVMGVSMLVAAIGWGAAATLRRRLLLFAAVTVAVAMATPLIRSWSALSVLPDSLEAYLRPRPGLTNFTLFPWAAFFTSGCVAGAWLDARQPVDDGRFMRWVGLAGIALAAGGYGASFLPPIYPETSFWTSSPTFLFLRLGVLLMLLAGAYQLGRVWRWEPLQEFGRASLFVYLVDFELV